MSLITGTAASTLISNLQRKFEINTAIETGTYLGAGTSWLADKFASVITIDISEEFQNRAKTNCNEHTNIEYLLGDSRDMIKVAVAKLTGPTLFWIDAHNTVQNYGPGNDDCPILEELDAIFASPFRHFLIIDDMNSFLPKERRIHHPPKELNLWPKINELKGKADAANYGYCARIDNDVMAILPNENMDELIGTFDDTI